MKRRNGFTLVELLVVIGIISVLVSMLLPALNKARQAAVRISCMSQMKQIAMGMMMYANENRQCLPARYGRAPQDSTQPAIYNVNDNWIWLIAPYLSDHYGTQTDASEGMVKLFTCPGYYAAGGAPTASFMMQRTYTISATADSYFSAGGRPSPWYGVEGLKLTQIEHPSDTALIFEIYFVYPSAHIKLYDNNTTQWNVGYDNLFPLRKPGVTTPYWYINKAPHSEGDSYGANVAFADGHVGWVRYDSAGHLPMRIFDPLGRLGI